MEWPCLRHERTSSVGTWPSKQQSEKHSPHHKKHHSSLIHSLTSAANSIANHSRAWHGSCNSPQISLFFHQRINTSSSISSHHRTGAIATVQVHSKQAPAERSSVEESERGAEVYLLKKLFIINLFVCAMVGRSGEEKYAPPKPLDEHGSQPTTSN